MGIKNCLAVLVLISNVAHAGKASVGLMEIDSYGEAQIHTTAKLKVSEKVFTQFSGADGTQECCAVSRVTSATATSDDIFNALDERPLNTYKLTRVRQNKSVYFGLAVASRNAQLRWDGNDGLFIFEDRKLTIAKTCLGSEGLHVLVMGNGSLKTHIYKRFDYDVRPTCTSEDIETQTR